MTLDIRNYLEDELRVRNVRYLDRGGFAEVYAGEKDEVLQAFKISHVPLDEERWKMAAEELECMKHTVIRGCRQIVQLLGWHWHNGYLITRWELGEYSLARRLQTYADEGRAGLPPDELRRYLLDAATAIDVIHIAGYLHRDIKPGNLLVFLDGGVRVADFGLTRFVGASTMSTKMAGTFGYMAPEAHSGKLTTSSDIYALAATAIKLTTGNDPFLGESPVTIWQAQVADRAETDGLTSLQTKAVREALDHDSAQRPFKTATDFVNAFLNESVVAGTSHHSSPKGWMTGIATAAKRFFGGSTKSPSPKTSGQKHKGTVESELQPQPATNKAVRQKAIVTRAIEPKRKAPIQAKRRKNRSTRDYLGPILMIGLRATPSDSPLLKALGEALLEIKPERFSAFNASTDPRDKEGCLVSLVRCAADHNNVARVREAAARVKHRFSSQPDAIFGPRSPYCQPDFIREITEELGVASG